MTAAPGVARNPAPTRHARPVRASSRRRPRSTRSTTSRNPYRLHLATRATTSTRAGSRGTACAAPLDVPYGPTHRRDARHLPAAAPGAPVFVFIHGGYWRMLSSKSSRALRWPGYELGITTVVANYALCPRVSIDEITRQMRAAVAPGLRRIDRHGGDPNRVVLGGHSAGPPSPRCVSRPTGGRIRPPVDPLAGAVMVRGLFDLRLPRWSNMQPMLQLDDGVIQRNSPLFHVRRCPTPALITWGGEEPDEFRRQSDDSAAWHDAGNRARRWPQEAATTSDAIYGFEDARSPLRAVDRPGHGEALKRWRTSRGPRAVEEFRRDQRRQRRFVRRGRGRDPRHHRPERRGQDHAVQHACWPGGTSAGQILFRGEDITGLPP